MGTVSCGNRKIQKGSLYSEPFSFRNDPPMPDLGTRIASMMATVGFYEHTGDWLFNTGLPAKTGVGGGIMGRSEERRVGKECTG